MKITRANVKEYAQKHGLQPLLLDGIPEGFSFVADDVTIGSVRYTGDYVAFVPLAEWDKPQSEIRARTQYGLQQLFKEATDTWQKR